MSHGCINLSPANAQWFYDNFGSGDPVVIKNSVGHLQQARRRVRLADVLALRLVPDPYPPLRVEVQRVGLADLERVVERVHVADDAVAPELRR